ncbi:isochorismatase family protein [Tsukamurella sp. 8F]|uniref:isochorismatase family protein n=1 Tax=unclassified Tsukamurella TaxID=2633480 RepID=UPI0023BA2A0C|nr:MULTISPECIES: isochorismatase family protein [unclassified Tsukamurella]MDF0531186.1 isochorismatase family protein [Tsukamurella sp. 8J]MDF0585867.1 isochorismatase family protein [Tsukamurella sp. 8F]
MSLPRAVSYPIPEPDCPQRVDWVVDPSRAVLLIHDMQDHFVRTYDRGRDPWRTAVPNMVALRAAARKAGVPVVYTAQPGDQDPEERALLADFWGPGLVAADEAVIDELRPEAGDVLLTKWRYSAFAKTDLAERMRAWERDQLVIVGIYAHIGVMTTALDAFMRDVQPYVVGDAVADFTAEDHAHAIRHVAARCGRVQTTAAVASALSEAEVTA